jgi:hypothetical protein
VIFSTHQQILSPLKLLVTDMIMLLMPLHIAFDFRFQAAAHSRKITRASGSINAPPQLIVPDSQAMP